MFSEVVAALMVHWAVFTSGAHDRRGKEVPQVGNSFVLVVLRSLSQVPPAVEQASSFFRQSSKEVFGVEGAVALMHWTLNVSFISYQFLESCRAAADNFQLLFHVTPCAGGAYAVPSPFAMGPWFARVVQADCTSRRSMLRLCNGRGAEAQIS